MRVFRASILILTVALVACGGDGGADTTLAETTTTVVEDSAGTVDFADMPQEMHRPPWSDISRPSNRP